jgi:hypothetical protein
MEKFHQAKKLLLAQPAGGRRSGKEVENEFIDCCFSDLPPDRWRRQYFAAV